jgi:hypothetical protein
VEFAVQVCCQGFNAGPLSWIRPPFSRWCGFWVFFVSAVFFFVAATVFYSITDAVIFCSSTVVSVQGDSSVVLQNLFYTGHLT